VRWKKLEGNEKRVEADFVLETLYIQVHHWAKYTSRQYSRSPIIAFQLALLRRAHSLTHTWNAVMDGIEGSVLSGAQKWNQINK
jgi:hypothetical protein